MIGKKEKPLKYFSRVESSRKPLKITECFFKTYLNYEVVLKNDQSEQNDLKKNDFGKLIKSRTFEHHPRSKLISR